MAMKKNVPVYIGDDLNLAADNRSDDYDIERCKTCDEANHVISYCSMMDKIKDQCLLKLLTLIGILVFSVKVNFRSSRRPVKDKSNIKCRQGTGFFVEGPRQLPANLQEDQVNTPLYVAVHKDLVYDDEEARNSVVELFYIRGDKKGLLQVQGTYVIHSAVHGDHKSLLVCETDMKTLYTTLLEKMQEAKRLVPMLPGDMKLSLRDSVFMFHHLHGRPLTISCISVKTFYYKKSMASSNNSKLAEFNYGCGDGDNLERKYIFNNTCEGYNGALVVRFEEMLNASDNADFVSEFSMYNYYSSHMLISLAVKERLSTQEMCKVCQDVMQKNFMGDNLSINKKQLIDLNLNDAMARLRSLQSLTKVPFLQLEEMANRGFYYEDNNSDFFSTVIFIKGHKLRGHCDVT